MMSESGKSRTLLQQIQEVSEQLHTAGVQDAHAQTGCKKKTGPCRKEKPWMLCSVVGFPPPPHAAGALHLPICPLTASATSMSEST